MTVFLILVAATSASPGDRVELASIENARVPQGGNILPSIINAKYEYYEVCGCGEEELHCDLKKKCITWTDGRKYDSLTSWDIKWDHKYDQTSKTCAVNSFKPIINITFRYPKWNRTDEAPQTLIEKWDRYLKNLITHEKGHSDLVVDAMRDLSHAVAQLSPAPTCSDLDRNVRALFRLYMAKMNKDQREYDEATDHGTRQGAVFP